MNKKKKQIIMAVVLLVIGTVLLIFTLNSSLYKDINTYEGLVMSADSDTVTSSGMTLSFENTSGKEFIYGDSYTIERYRMGRWCTVKPVVQGGFNDIGYHVSRDSSWEVDWEWLYGNLPPGEYRIVKYVFEDLPRPVTEADYIYLAAGFTINS